MGWEEFRVASTLGTWDALCINLLLLSPTNMLLFNGYQNLRFSFVFVSRVVYLFVYFRNSSSDVEMFVFCVSAATFKATRLLADLLPRSLFWRPSRSTVFVLFYTRYFGKSPCR